MTKEVLCPSCLQEMTRKDVGDIPTWFCFLKGCPVRTLEAELEEGMTLKEKGN